MDETLLTTAADAQPEAEAVGEEPAAAQDAVTEPETAATAATPAEEPEGSSEETVPPEDEAVFFTVKHKKQIHSLSRDDAMDYAQKGMKYDDLQPLLESLKYVATSEGKTLAEFVEAIRSQHEDNLFLQLMDRCGDEEIARELLEVEKGKHKAAFESLLEREKNEELETDEAVTQRMAEEFEVLRREFPQYTEFAKVPQSIVREAVEKGVTLLDAQLRYEHRQRIKAENARAAQTAAAKASTGTQMSAGIERGSPVEAALMKGLWG